MEMRERGGRTPWATSVLGLMALVLIGLPGVSGDARQEADDGDTKEAARAEIQRLLDEADWRAATKAVKAYRRKHAESDEDKAECERWLSFVDGSKELQGIEDEYRKKEQARRTSEKLTEFQEKFRQHDSLIERARELQAAARSTYVLEIEDFEDWKKEPEPGVVVETSDSSRMTLVEGPKMAKHGDFAGKWSPGKAWVSWSVEPPETDWRPYAFFCCWIYNAKLGPRPGLIEIEATSGGGNYFQYLLAIDWTGWREIRMPLHTKTSKFARHGGADWGLIERLDFDHDDDSGTTVEIILDDIRLEKAVK